MSEKIGPALSAEEWAKVFAHDFNGIELNNHKWAALMLNEHPFGFRWEDVARLHLLADAIERAVTAADLLANLRALEEAPLRDLADRVAALLPPQE